MSNFKTIYAKQVFEYISHCQIVPCFSSMVKLCLIDSIPGTVNAEGNGINLENAYNKLNKLVLLGNLSFSVTVANEKVS